MIKPIPKRLLPHKVKYLKYLGNTGESDSWEEPVILSYVKLEDRKTHQTTNNGREVYGNAKMFYDKINSSGLNERPIENSKIIFNEFEYLIKEIKTLYADSSNVHHYEMILE